VLPLGIATVDVWTVWLRSGYSESLYAARKAIPCMGLLSEIFTWWGGNTWGTRLFTLRKGRQVGEDEFGNRYYVQKSGNGPLGVPARWVTYAHASEPSQVPPDCRRTRPISRNPGNCGIR
jgi:NADH ubiquinone oxidoreductase subunit NDUFA12